MLFTREEILKELSDKIIVVNFTKVNGDKREMRCSLKPELLPSDTSRTASTNSNVVNVWDLDANDWRAFRLDSINYVVLSDTRIERKLEAKAEPKPTQSQMSLKDIILSPRVGS